VREKIIFYIPSIEGGGVEKNFFLLLKYLSKKIDKIYVITADKKKSNLGQIIYISPNSNKWEKKGRFIKNLICIFLLIKNFWSKKATILSFQSNISAVVISKLLGFRILIRLNTSLNKYLNNVFKRIIFRIFYSLSDRIIVNSKLFQKELLDMNLKSYLIYNLQDSYKKRGKLKFFTGFKGLKILNIARLTEQKDHLTLIKSLKILKEKNVNFRCCIIGKGPCRERLIKEILNLNLKSVVKLIGYKNKAEQFIHQSNIFVLSSRFEGLPNVLIEAQKYNIPVISSNCPTGPNEILLNGKLGDLFPVKNYSILSHRLYNFSKNSKPLKNKSKKAKKYLKRFNPIINSKKYFELLFAK
tara:strand:+ start:1769 stop:2836 length:1068 start_codon:yes stop_codon:yes gene_type:complete